jgi:hypothetical protein
MTGRRFLTALCVVTGLAVVLVAAVLVAFLALAGEAERHEAERPEAERPEAERPGAERPGAAGKDRNEEVKQPSRKQEAPTRRVPVAGRKGHWVVFEPDGSSYLEAPDGTRTRLASAAEGPPPPPPPQRATPERRPGQLVVCDEGVVDVPKNAVITLVAADKVVTHEPDGSSVTYFTDGRVERRGRDRRPTPPGTP